jgi:uncharacterized protein YecT (DUF1311 family)
MPFAIIMLLIVMSFPALAMASDGSQCNYDGNQLELNNCAINDFTAADAQLNAKYKVVMAQLPTSKQKALRSEQRKWLKQRDPKCKAEAKDSEGGSIWTLIFMGCLQTATEQRTKALETWQNK